jgi:hypothetical protein
MAEPAQSVEPYSGISCRTKHVHGTAQRFGSVSTCSHSACQITAQSLGSPSMAVPYQTLGATRASPHLRRNVIGTLGV